MLREIKLDEWVKSGEGDHSITYDNLKDDTILLKLSKSDPRSIRDMQGEFDLIDKIMKLNINTPKALEKVQYKGAMGLIYERITNKKSLGRLCHDNPQNIKEYAKDFANETLKLHSIKCADIGLKNYKDLYIDSISNGAQDKIYTKKVLELIKNEVNECDKLVHGDLTVGNLINSNNKWYWIDLGKIGYGDSTFDLVETYYSFNVLSSFKFVRDIFHMSKNQLIELWDNFIKEYTYLSGQNYEILIKKIKRLSVAYLFRIWATGRHIPILSQIVHHNSRKYYDEIIGK